MRSRNKPMLGASLAEMLGTFFFVGVVLATTTPGDPATLAPFIIGLALTAAIYFTSKASLACINPAVTLGLLMRGDLGVWETAVYIVAQAAGAVLAFLWWWATLGGALKA